MRTFSRVITGVVLAAVLAAGPAVAGKIIIGLGSEPSSIDPHYHNLGPNNQVARHIFDRLVDSDENQRLRPGLAESYQRHNLGVQTAPRGSFS